MGGMRANLWTALLVLGATACATITIGDDEEGARIEVFEGVTFDESWEAAIDTFEELRLPIDNLERESGVVTTDWILLDEADAYMDCPDEASRNEEGRFNVFLREIEGGIRVTVNASYRAEDDTGGRLVCVSDGDYEELILRRIRLKVT